jgi:competence protein ComEC
VLHKEVPFIRIGLPLCAGIVSGLYFQPGSTFLFTVLIIILSGFLFSLFYNRNQHNYLYGFILTFSFAVTGLLLYTNEKASLTTLKPETTLFSCSVSDFPEEKENTFMLKVKLSRIIEPNKTEPVNGSMLLYFKKDSETLFATPGDILRIKCIPVEITNRGNPYEFDYRFFMENQHIRYYAFINRGDIIQHSIPHHRKLIHTALITREKIINMFRERGIKGERLALVSAITLGQKSMLDREQKLNFIKAGVMHIMAVSGLHAIILSLFVFNILFFMKGRYNIFRVAITILILWSFAFITGLTPSVLRATLMYTFLQSGKLLKRPANNINSVLASAFFLIIIKPSVIFDAGFLLSYSAVLYIICFYNSLYLLISFKNWFVDKIWQSAAVTIVAQAGTLPLTIMLFNRFPTYFILANITIVPVSNLLIITGCLIPLFFHIPVISKFLALLINHLTGLTELLTSEAASLPYSSIENIGSTTIECVCFSATIFLFSYWLMKKKTIPSYYPVLLFLLLVIAGTGKDIVSKSTNEIIVYNTQGSSTIGIRTGKILNLFSDSTLVVPEVKKHCATLGLKIKSTVINNNYRYIRAGGKKILITNYLNNKIIRNFVPDYLILTGSSPRISYDTDLAHFPGCIIISSEPRAGFHLRQNSLFSTTESIHYVRHSGAFVKRI